MDSLSINTTGTMCAQSHVVISLSYLPLLRRAV
jgi:hypothetical protein